MEGKTVTCHIVKDDSAINVNYGAVRGNYCQADFVHSPFVHELIFILDGFLNQFGKEKAVEAISRFGKTLAIGHDEMTAVRKFGAWPSDCLSVLCEILKLFQTLQTLDATVLAKRKTREILNGSVVAVPNILFKRISKVDVEYFKNNAHLVTEKKISLKQLADNFATALRMKDTEKALLEISGFSNLNDLREVFPGSFTEEVLDGFIGAVIGKKPNNTGEMLQDYIKGVIEGKPEEDGARAVFEEIDKDSFDFSSLSEYSCILINCSHISTESLMQIQNMKSLKKSLSVLLLMKDEKEAMEAYKVFTHGDVDPKLVFFTHEDPVVKSNFCENVRYGILLAGVIYKPPLMAFNGSLSQLEEVISKLVAPGTVRIAYYSDGSQPLTKVHSEVKCSYYSSKASLEKFRKELGGDFALLKEVRDSPVGSDGAGVEDQPGTSGACNSTMVEGSGLGVLQESLNVSGINAVDFELNKSANLEDGEERKVAKKAKKCLSSLFDLEDDTFDLQIMSRQKKETENLAARIIVKPKGRNIKNMTKMAKFSQSITGQSINLDPPEKPTVKSDDSEQKKINSFFKSVTKSSDGKSSKEDIEVLPSIDELLQIPDRSHEGGKTMNEVLDDLDIEIAKRKQGHEEEMSRVDTSVAEEKMRQEERSERMKINAMNRDRLEAEVTEPVLRKLFEDNLEYLKKIQTGEVESSRHKAFHKSVRTRHMLYYSMITDPFTDYQLDLTLELLGQVWMRNKREQLDNNEYVWKVLIAELFIKIYMDFLNVSKQEAEKRISETPLKGDDDNAEKL